MWALFQEGIKGKIMIPWVMGFERQKAYQKSTIFFDRNVLLQETIILILNSLDWNFKAPTSQRTELEASGQHHRWWSFFWKAGSRFIKNFHHYRTGYFTRLIHQYLHFGIPWQVSLQLTKNSCPKRRFFFCICCPRVLLFNGIHSGKNNRKWSFLYC